MQEEILKLYEKVQDQLSQEEFLAEMNQIRENNFSDVPFMNDVDLAREVLKIMVLMTLKLFLQKLIQVKIMKMYLSKFQPKAMKKVLK